MTDPRKTLVICDNVACPLHESMMTLELLRSLGVDMPDIEEARTSKLSCQTCDTAEPEREGYMIYVPLEEFATVGAMQTTDVAYGPVNHWQQIPRQENTAIPSESEETASHDQNAQPTTGVPVGVVLDVIPYGGYILRFEDTDAGMNYGPRQEELPRQDPANPNYILQLQDDLVFLCYWNTARARPSITRKQPKEKELAKPIPGEFHYSMIGSILALKEDLHAFYGVPTTKKLNEAKISLTQGSKLTLQGLNVPIYYDPELANPIFGLFEKVLEPVAECRETAISVAKRWPQILKRLKHGLIIQNDRKKVSKLVEQTLAALVACDRALKSANSVGGKRSTPVSAEALIADPAFDIDRKAGKSNWRAFESAVTNWGELHAQLGDKIHACLSSLNTFVPAADEDPGVVAAADELRTSYGQLVISLQAAYTLGWDLLGGIPSVLPEYGEKLRKYGCVEWATAAYIHAMRYGIPIGGTGAIKRGGGLLAFRLPDEGIDVGVSYEIDAMYPMAIDEAKKKGVPPGFVLERFGVESGFNHTFTLRNFAATKAHKGVKLPLMGTDYINWCPAGGTKATFNFSEMFSRGPADWQLGGGRGYLGPILNSRGWGVSQATVGTFVSGVTPNTRDREYRKLQWIHGLPVPPDNTKVVLAEFMKSTKDGVLDGVGILRNKFNNASKKRDCTYADVGGEMFDCHNCLKRFDIDGDFVPVGDPFTSYRLDVDEDRFLELVGVVRPENDAARVEYPCSWLTSIMRYAGSGKRAINRLRETAHTVANPAAGSTLERYLKQLSS